MKKSEIKSKIAQMLKIAAEKIDPSKNPVVVVPSVEKFDIDARRHDALGLYLIGCIPVSFEISYDGGRASRMTVNFVFDKVHR